MKPIGLLLLCLYICACAGPPRHQRELYLPKTETACKALFKKQVLQYKIAVREGKSRKKVPSAQVTSPQKRIKSNDIARDFRTADHSFPPIVLPVPIELPDEARAHPYIHDVVPAALLPVRMHKRSEKIQQQKKIPEKTGMENPLPARGFSFTALPIAGIAISGLAGMTLLGLFRDRAQRLSRWANRNPWKTRTLIGTSQLTMAGASLWLGDYLYNEGFMIPEYARLVSVAAFATAAIFYPSGFHTNGSPAFGYLERKFHDAALFTTAAMLTVYAGNHYNLAIQTLDKVPHVNTAPATTEQIVSMKFVNSKINLVKRKFEKVLTTYLDKPKQLTHGDKVALTILAAVGFALLTVGVAAASCNLSCSGNEGAAVAVLIGGAALIAWGLTASLKAIHRYPSKPETKKTEAAPAT